MFYLLTLTIPLTFQNINNDPIEREIVTEYGWRGLGSHHTSYTLINIITGILDRSMTAC